MHRPRCGLLASVASIIIIVVVVFLVAAVAADDVGHVQEIFGARRKRVARRNDAEPEEVEHAQKRRAVGAVATEAEDDVGTLELVLGILEQLHQALARAGGQDAGRHLHVEATVHEDCLPLNLQPCHRRHLEAEIDGGRRVGR